jgi:hypothetical protein
MGNRYGPPGARGRAHRPRHRASRYRAGRTGTTRARHLARHDEPDQAASVAVTAITTLAPGQHVPLLITQARAVGKDITAVSRRTGSRYAQALREAVPA